MLASARTCHADKLQYLAVQGCKAELYIAEQCSAGQGSTELGRGGQGRAGEVNAGQGSAMQWSAVQCSAGVQGRATQCHSMFYAPALLYANAKQILLHGSSLSFNGRTAL